jgi:hypothetical protein
VGWPKAYLNSVERAQGLMLSWKGSARVERRRLLQSPKSLKQLEIDGKPECPAQSTASNAAIFGLYEGLSRHLPNIGAKEFDYGNEGIGFRSKKVVSLIKVTCTIRGQNVWQKGFRLLRSDEWNYEYHFVIGYRIRSKNASSRCT